MGPGSRRRLAWTPRGLTAGGLEELISKLTHKKMLYFDEQREKFGFVDVFAAKRRFQETKRAMFIGTSSNAFVTHVAVLTQRCLIRLNSQLIWESESLCGLLFILKYSFIFWNIYFTSEERKIWLDLCFYVNYKVNIPPINTLLKVYTHSTIKVIKFFYGR